VRLGLLRDRSDRRRRRVRIVRSVRVDGIVVGVIAVEEIVVAGIVVVNAVGVITGRIRCVSGLRRGVRDRRLVVMKLLI
jgi:hypothetical protein